MSNRGKHELSIEIGRDAARVLKNLLGKKKFSISMKNGEDKVEVGTVLIDETNGSLSLIQHPAAVITVDTAPTAEITLPCRTWMKKFRPILDRSTTRILRALNHAGYKELSNIVFEASVRSVLESENQAQAVKMLKYRMEPAFRFYDEMSEHDQRVISAVLRDLFDDLPTRERAVSMKFWSQIVEIFQPEEEEKEPLPSPIPFKTVQIKNGEKDVAAAIFA